MWARFLCPVRKRLVGWDMSGKRSENEVVSFCLNKALEDLPAMPGIIIRVLEETEKSEPSAATLESIICADQAIASKVLRVVNSAYYGVQGRVSSVGQAVVILGTKQVKNLVLSAAAMSTMPTASPSHTDALRSFWVHSYATAAAAQLVAKIKDLPSVDVETVFVGGLLHDVGRLFLITHFPELYTKALDRAAEVGGGLEEIEQEIFGAGHAEIGAAVAERWSLPGQLIDIVRLHEGPLPDDASVPVIVVHAADEMAKTLFQSDQSILSFDIDPLAQDWLGFSRDEFRAVRDETVEKVEQASGVFGLLSAA
jgi:putative nucleotidyltransferase with HDIG domain